MFSVTACGNNHKQPEVQKTTVQNHFNETEINSEITHKNENLQNNNDTPIKNEVTTVAELSKAEIIDKYKNAAYKSSANIKSVQNITLNDIVINDGTGFANSVIGVVKPIISKVVSGNSTEFDGVTGGYSELSESDVKTASASKSGENTIIKLEMNEQTDSGEMHEKSGSVGHAISVIGDLSTVMGQLSDSGLPVEIANDNVSATYVNPLVNITMDNDGNIINGTWSYTVTIILTDFKVAGSTVDKTAVTIENVITYNGGFSE